MRTAIFWVIMQCTVVTSFTALWDNLQVPVSFKFLSSSSQICLLFSLKCLLTLCLTLFRLSTFLWFCISKQNLQFWPEEQLHNQPSDDSTLLNGSLNNCTITVNCDQYVTALRYNILWAAETGN